MSGRRFGKDKFGSARMRVLLVINSLILAGAEVLLREMAPCLRDAGLDVSIALLKTLESPLEKELRGQGFPFLPIESAIYSPRHVLSLARHLHRFDLVHSYLFPAQLWLAMANPLSRRRVPLVTTEQSTTNGRRKAHLRPLDRWMYGRYSAIGCNSQATFDSLRAWVPEYSDRMSIVYNGVPLERFQRSAAADRAQVLPTASGRKIISFVARFEHAKDHPTLLRAIAGLPDADLLLVGDGPLRPQVAALASDLGIAARVHFLGRRHDVPQLLKMSDVYVHCSHWEGFGIAAVEAMAAGLPVVATDVPGLSEIVSGAGVLFAPGDDKALAGHLRRIFDSPAMREELSRASLRRAPDFSIERAVQGWIQLYESVLSRSGRERRQPNYAD